MHVSFGPTTELLGICFNQVMPKKIFIVLIENNNFRFELPNVLMKLQFWLVNIIRHPINLALQNWEHRDKNHFGGAQSENLNESSITKLNMILCFTSNLVRFYCDFIIWILKTPHCCVNSLGIWQPYKWIVYNDMWCILNIHSR